MNMFFLVVALLSVVTFTYELVVDYTINWLALCVAIAMCSVVVVRK